MLVLSRKLNETIHIGQDIVIKVVKVKGSIVGLGIEAPAEVKVLRSELLPQESPLPESKPNTTSKIEPGKIEPGKSGPLGAFTIAG